MRALLPALLLLLLTAACSSPPADRRGGEAADSSKNSAPADPSSRPSTPQGADSRSDREADQGNITIAEPEEGGSIRTNPFVVRGTARTFENNVVLHLYDEGGALLAEEVTTAQGELGDFNPWEREIYLTRDPGRRVRVEGIEHSAKDGAVRSRAVVDASIEIPASQLRLFFPNPQRSPSDCSIVFSLSRRLPASRSIARLALEALIDGPTEMERRSGVSNPFPEGSAVRSVNLRDGVVTVDFNERLQNVGGSCRATGIRASVEKTLLAIEGIERVRILAGGSEELALQP
ncbi:MAG TPA: GerMN domain-containing protein [Thermoanaerobaculia bacterium]|nr:GerMN domain-containing protein [Thermoanaerobaculia bacterium]